MDEGIFVAGEADVADFAGFLGGNHGFHGAASGKDAVGIFHADDFMVLEEVDAVGLEALEGFVDLFCGVGAGAAVDLGHEEDFGAVAIAQGLAHADFGAAVMVIPAVVHEGDAAIYGGADDFDSFGLVFRLADVESAEADGGNLLAGAAEGADEHVATACLGAKSVCASGDSDSRSGGKAHELAAVEFSAHVSAGNGIGNNFGLQVALAHHKSPLVVGNLAQERRCSTGFWFCER